MEADDDMLEIHSEPELELIALDAELDNMEEMENIDQLRILVKEINIIMGHKIVPSTNWYEERVGFIRAYNSLNWEYLITQFRDSNRFLASTSERLKETMAVILDQWEKGLFSLQHYQYVIYNVNNIWTYYSSNYVTSDGMEDLLMGMSSL
jgi:hypothetical protein